MQEHSTPLKSSLRSRQEWPILTSTESQHTKPSPVILREEQEILTFESRWTAIPDLLLKVSSPRKPSSKMEPVQTNNDRDSLVRDPQWIWTFPESAEHNLARQSLFAFANPAYHGLWVSDCTTPWLNSFWKLCSYRLYPEKVQFASCDDCKERM